MAKVMIQLSRGKYHGGRYNQPDYKGVSVELHLPEFALAEAEREGHQGWKKLGETLGAEIESAFLKHYEEGVLHGNPVTIVVDWI